MTFEIFAGRLESIGAKYDSLNVRLNDEEAKTVRYFTYNGKYSEVDAGDCRYLTETTMHRVCRQLGLTEAERRMVIGELPN